MCQFEPFQRVLVRDGKSEIWRANILSHVRGQCQYLCVSDEIYFECIPYEGNESLLGTDLDPSQKLSMQPQAKTPVYTWGQRIKFKITGNQKFAEGIYIRTNDDGLLIVIDRDGAQYGLQPGMVFPA